jgi:uncharacterized protein YndB with AHSA1/START domain
MRWLRIVLGTVVLLGLVVIGIGFALPAGYKVERSLVIEAPPERIFPFIAAPRRWAQWSIWTRRDPAMAIEYFGPESGAGAGWRWDSKTEGRGEMTLVEADPARGLRYTLYFPDFDSTSSGAIVLAASGIGTKVTWTNAGDVGHNPLKHYMAAAMDRLVGPDFDAGLHNLKALAEKQ